MDRLADVSTGRLHEALAAAEGSGRRSESSSGSTTRLASPRRRSLNGTGFPRPTVYNWLVRLENLDEEPVEAALREPPAAAGYEADEWHPRLLRRHLAERFSVEYSLRHIRRPIDDL